MFKPTLRSVTYMSNAKLKKNTIQSKFTSFCSMDILFSYDRIHQNQSLPNFHEYLFLGLGRFGPSQGIGVLNFERFLFTYAIHSNRKVTTFNNYIARFVIDWLLKDQKLCRIHFVHSIFFEIFIQPNSTFQTSKSILYTSNKTLYKLNSTIGKYYYIKTVILVINEIHIIQSTYIFH